MRHEANQGKGKQKSTYEYVWFYCSFHRLQLSQLQTHNALNSINTRKHGIILRALIFRVPFTIFRFCDNIAILFSSFLCVFCVQLFWTFLFFVDAAVWLWILDIFLRFGVVVIVFQSFIAKWTSLPFQLLLLPVVCCSVPLFTKKDEKILSFSISRYYDTKANV